MRTNQSTLSVIAAMLRYGRFTAECIYNAGFYSTIHNARRFANECVKAGILRRCGKDGRAYVYEVVR